MTVKTIIIVNDHAHVSGGQPKIAITTAIGLAARGYDVTYFATTGPIDPDLERAPVKVICLDQSTLAGSSNRLRDALRGIWNRQAAKSLGALLAPLNPDEAIVHIHGCDKELSPSVGPVITKSKVPHLFTMHGYFLACPNGGFFDYQNKTRCTRTPLSADCLRTNCDSRSRLHKFWRVIRQVILHRVGTLPKGLKHVVYLSQTQKRVISQFLPTATQQHHLPNMIDAYDGPRIQCEDNKPFMFVGRIAAEKGAVEFAAAAKQANVKAVFIGDGPDFQAVQDANPQAEMLGWQDKDKVATLLRGARALVLPSLWYETFGLVAYEARSMGIPVIIGGWNAGAEAITHMTNGLVYDHEADLSGMLEQAKDDQLIQNLSTNAYDMHAKTGGATTLDEHMDHLIGLYNTILTDQLPSA